MFSLPTPMHVSDRLQRGASCMNMIEKNVEFTWVDTQAYCHILYERYIAYGIYQSYVSHGSSPCMSHVTNDHTFYHIVYSNLTLATQVMSQII